MKLTELKPQLLRVDVPGRLRQYVDTLAEAQGVLFLCPKCFVENGGARGTHSVLCWFANRGVLDSEEPGPGRWTAVGTGIADLTLNGSAPDGSGSRSVLLTGPGCGWHGYITNGEVTST